MNGVNRVIGIFALAFLLLPVVILFLETGPSHFLALWAQPDARRAIMVTVVSGLIALGSVIGLGTPLAFLLSRGLDPKWQRLWGTVLVIPLLMPPLVLGLVLAYVTGPATWLGQALDLSNSWAGLILAQIYESLPYYVLTAWSYLATIPITWEENVLVLGKTPAEIRRYVLWPAARPAFTAAAAMAWARITGAFGAPVVVAYHPSALPVAIWIRLQEQGLPASLGLALWLLLISLPLPIWLNRRVNRARGLG